MPTPIIAPYLYRGNIFVPTNHAVSRIRFIFNKDRTQLIKAIGAEWYVTSDTSSNNNKIIRARRKAILSLGTIASPKILELSGIGNKDTFTAAGF